MLASAGAHAGWCGPRPPPSALPEIVGVVDQTADHVRGIIGNMNSAG